MFGIPNLISSAGATTADVMGIYTSDFKPLFSTTVPMKATVKPMSKWMEHPVETGATITDHVIFSAIEIELAIILTSADYKDVYQQIKDYFRKAALVIVQTRTGVFKNLGIQDMPHEENPEMFDAITMMLKFKEVQFVTAQYGIVPRNPANSNTVQKGNVQPTAASEKNNGSFAGAVTRNIFK